MTDEEIYSIIDQPEILQFTFYPRQDFTQGPPNSTDHFVSVEKDISISCRFYLQREDSPSILYFHGNGEVASDYDFIAPIYNRQGMNIFIADYRGYGSSDGSPTFKAAVEDAHPIFNVFRQLLHEKKCTGNMYIMGRSMGSLPAVELALHYQEQLKGLIIDSGFASLLKGLRNLGFPIEAFGLEDADFPNLTKIRKVALPTLIMHGQNDTLIPSSEARDLYKNSGAEDKRLLIIPHADHNDIIIIGIQEYFKALSDFIFH
jgi:alpha-beta hydrolase superfamily lysophospholipase